MLGLSIGLGIGSQAVSGPTAPPATGTATMTQISTNDANRIYQRSTTTGGGQSKGQGTIPLTISSATAGTLNARCRDADGSTIVQPEWAAATIANAATTANIAGVDARLGWFYLDIKDVSGTWQNGTTLVGMGALFGVAGQSLMQRMVGRRDDTNTLATLSITPSPYSRALASYQDGASDYIPTVATMPWSAFADVAQGAGPNSAGGAEFLNRMVTMLGVNCGMIGHTRGGQWLHAFIDASASSITNADGVRLHATISRAGGAFEGFFWGQGHNNATSNYLAAVYQTQLSILLAQIQATNSFSSCKYYMFGIPAVSGNGLGTNWAYNQINKGQSDWCTANGGTYIHCDDFKQADSYHPTQVGSVTLGRAMYRTTRTNYGQATGQGPAPVSATRVGTAITLTVSDVGQSSLVLVGTPGNRIKVFPTGLVNNSGAPNDNCFPISSITSPNKTTLTITLANDPGDQNVLDLYCYFRSGPVDTTLDNIYDDVNPEGFSHGRNLQANFVPIAIAAANPAGTAANAPPGGVIAPTSFMNGTGTGAAYTATGVSGFGQDLTAGFIASNQVGPSLSAYTVDIWLKCPTLAANMKFAKGWCGQYDFLQVNNADMKIHNGISFLVGSTVLTAGHYYHIAYQADGTSKELYLTDITAAGSSTRIGQELSGIGMFWADALRQYVADCSVGTSPAIAELAVRAGKKYSGTTYTMPSAPFTGTETDMVALYHFDGNTTEVVGR